MRTISASPSTSPPSSPKATGIRTNCGAAAEARVSRFDQASSFLFENGLLAGEFVAEAADATTAMGARSIIAVEVVVDVAAAGAGIDNVDVVAGKF